MFSDSVFFCLTFALIYARKVEKRKLKVTVNSLKAAENFPIVQHVRTVYSSRMLKNLLHVFYNSEVWLLKQNNLNEPV